MASLEAHLDGMRSVYMLNADKLEYNVRVLCECMSRGEGGASRQEGRRPGALGELGNGFLLAAQPFADAALRASNSAGRQTLLA